MSSHCRQLEDGKHVKLCSLLAAFGSIIAPGARTLFVELKMCLHSIENTTAEANEAHIAPIVRMKL